MSPTARKDRDRDLLLGTAMVVASTAVLVVLLAYLKWKGWI